MVFTGTVIVISLCMEHSVLGFPLCVLCGDTYEQCMISECLAALISERRYTRHNVSVCISPAKNTIAMRRLTPDQRAVGCLGAGEASYDVEAATALVTHDKEADHLWLLHDKIASPHTYLRSFPNC